MFGITVCRMHGGQLPTVKAKSERAKVIAEMQRFVKPIAENDPEAYPIYAFEVEYRRTIARIRYYDEKLAELEPEALGWGKTKEEDRNAAEFPGIDTTYEAAANMYHKLQWEERQHLVRMTKIYINAKLDEKKLQLLERQVLAFDGAITRLLARLGHDTTSPEIRNVVREEMLAALPKELGR